MTKALIVKTTPLPQSRISFELEIPSETCKTYVNETINTISRSAKIPGFRLGKIPKQVLIQRIGITQLHASALEKIIDKSWHCLLYTSPSPRDVRSSRMPSSA